MPHFTACTKSCGSPLGVFAFLRFWRGRLSEQPAGPYVNRRARARSDRSFSCACLPFFHHNKQLFLCSKTRHDASTAKSKHLLTLQAEDKRNSRRSPLPSFSTLGSLRQRKAAPPTASALQSLNPRQTTTKSPSLAHLHHHHHQLPALSLVSV